METLPNNNELPSEQRGDLIIEDVPQDVLNEVEQKAPAGVIVDHARRALIIVGAGLATGAAAIQRVAADIAINWTEIGSYFSGIATIMPGITELIVSVIAPIILLSVVGFITGLLNEFLSGIRGAFARIGGR